MAHAAAAPLVGSRQAFPVDPPGKNEASSSGVSWGAVIGGAVVVAAISLSLLALGTGIGLSSFSPWSSPNAAVSTVGLTAIVWMVVSQIIASSMGGYMAGRLRTKWVNVHTDEVYFRDTAHGFLVWAVGLVIAVGLVASAAGSVTGRTTQAGVTAASGTSPNAYYVDSLFRLDASATGQNEALSDTQRDASLRAEAGGIFTNGLLRQGLPEPDKTYLAKLVSARTGLSESDAENRVSQIFAQAQQAADTARKAMAHLMYWTFFALLVGAFCASFSATIGGKQRDRIAVA